MRRPLVLVLVLFSGCVATMETQRVALAPIPGTPQTLSSSTGLGLATRALTAEPKPQAQGSAVAMPAWQPEPGAVVRVAERTYASAKLALAPSGFGARSPFAEPRLPANAMAVELGAGVGHDAKLSEVVGLAFSGELGLSVVSQTVASAAQTETFPVLMISARGATAVYVEGGPLRAYLGLSLGTGTWNDPRSVQTTSCGLFIPCLQTDTGRLTQTAVAMAGAGVRWQPHQGVSVSLEGWLPVTEVATRLPFTVLATLRLGHFDVGPRR